MDKSTNLNYNISGLVANLQPNLLVNMSKSALSGPSNVSVAAKNKRQQRTDEITEAANKKKRLSAVEPEEAEIAPKTQVVRKPKRLTKAQEMSRANAIIQEREYAHSFC